MTIHNENGKSPRVPAALSSRSRLAIAGAVLLATLAACREPRSKSPGHWVLIANLEGSISLLDTDTSVVHGPYLQGQLGSASSYMFDAAVTPDGETALLTTFGESRVYFVDLRDLSAPAVLGHLDLPFFAEDVTLTADGEYALVTDGAFSPRVVTIAVKDRTIVQTAQHKDVYAIASAIGRSGTVVTVNYFGSGTVLDPYKKPAVRGGPVSTWTLDATGHLTHGSDYPLFLRASGEVTTDPLAHGLHPVNVAVAPDGATVLVPDVMAYNVDKTRADPDGDFSAGAARFAVAVYRITAPGVLAFQSVITGLPRAAQSVAFSSAGDEAYLLGNDGRDYDAERKPTATPDRLLVLKITAPGEVSWDETRSADLGRTSSSQLFGVDNLVVQSGKAYASYPTASGVDPPLRVVSVVDLRTMEVTRLAAGLPADEFIAGLALVPRGFEPEPPAGAATCAGFCGTGNPEQACMCDAACVDRGDCCTDYAALCTFCYPSACTGGQKCVNQAGGIYAPGGIYACGCPAGSADDGAGHCVDVDECTAGTATCKVGATCVNESDGYRCGCTRPFVPDGAGGCECPYGFHDDGAGGCAVTDQCADGSNACQPSATCTPRETGGYDCTCTAPMVVDGFGGCTCKVGYQSDGAGKCVDVDECATGLAACHGDATCRNVDGRYYCDCALPLVGDGTGGCVSPPP